MKGIGIFLAYVSEGNDTEVEQKMQYWKTELQAKPGEDKGQMKVLECGIRWAVEARRKGRGDEQEQRRQGEQAQNSGLEQSKQGKQVHFGDEEQFEETRAESTVEQKATNGLAEMRTGRGSAGVVRGRDERCQADESSRKGKGKGNGGKGEHGGKEKVGRKGAQQVEILVMDEDQENMKATKNEGEEEEDHEEDARKLVETTQKEEAEQEEQRGRVVPNMGAGGSYPQTTVASEEEGEEERAAKCEKEGKEKTANGEQRHSEEEGETRRMRWADCEHDEEKEKEEQETERERQQEVEKRKRKRRRQGEKQGTRS